MLSVLYWTRDMETRGCPTGFTCPDHLPRSFARLIWATAQRPAVDTRNHGAAFREGRKSEMPGAACSADGGSPLSYPVRGKAAGLFNFPKAGIFAVRTEFPSDLRTKPDLAGKRRQLTPAVCGAARQYGDSRRFCVEKLRQRLPCSSFKRSCVRWTHTRFVMPIRRISQIAARPEFASFTARLR